MCCRNTAGRYIVTNKINCTRHPRILLRSPRWMEKMDRVPGTCWTIPPPSSQQEISPLLGFLLENTAFTLALASQRLGFKLAGRERQKKRFVFDPPRQKHGFYINIRGRTRRGNNIRAVISHRAQRKGPSPASEANAATTLASRLSNIEECCCCKLLWCLWDFIPRPESKLWRQGFQQQDVYSFPLPAVSKPWEWLSDEPARVFTWIDSRHLLIR